MDQPTKKKAEKWKNIRKEFSHLKFHNIIKIIFIFCSAWYKYDAQKLNSSYIQTNKNKYYFILSSLQNQNKNKTKMSLSESQPNTPYTFSQNITRTIRSVDAGTDYGGVSMAESNASVNQIAQDLLELQRVLASTSHVDLTSSNHQLYNSQHYTHSQLATHLGDVESAILRSHEPIEIHETEEISALGYRGIWANKQEVLNWRGEIPLCQYRLNEDATPEIITKKSQQHLEYVQELAIRYKHLNNYSVGTKFF